MTSALANAFARTALVDSCKNSLNRFFCGSQSILQTLEISTRAVRVRRWSDPVTQSIMSLQGYRTQRVKTNGGRCFATLNDYQIPFVLATAPARSIGNKFGCQILCLYRDFVARPFDSRWLVCVACDYFCFAPSCVLGMAAIAVRCGSCVGCCCRAIAHVVFCLLSIQTLHRMLFLQLPVTFGVWATFFCCPYAKYFSPITVIIFVVVGTLFIAPVALSFVSLCPHLFHLDSIPFVRLCWFFSDVYACFQPLDLSGL